jgi:hypothetical protein
MDVEKEARDHPDFDHDAVLHLAKHVRVLEEFRDTSDMRFVPDGPYEDIVMWVDDYYPPDRARKVPVQRETQVECPGRLKKRSAYRAWATTAGQDME